MVIEPSAVAIAIRPAAAAERPKPSCSISGMRKGCAPCVMRVSEPAITDVRKVAHAHQREIHDRRGMLARMPEIGDAEDQADRDQEDRPRPFAASARRFEAEKKRAQRDAREDEADEVEAARDAAPSPRR